jgi:hypothetical protein
MTDILTVKPANYDGFTFRYDTINKKMIFLYLDDLSKDYGVIVTPDDVPEGRERYHVLLTSVKNKIPHIDAPFVSTFMDAFVYAEGVARSGFSGVMIKASDYAAGYMASTVLMLMKLYMKLYMGTTGFVYTTEEGKILTYTGKDPSLQLPEPR